MDIHIPTFDVLFREIAPQAEVSHVIRGDLLARAQTEGIPGIRADTLAALSALDGDAVLCTCSTLGTMVDELADPRVLRVDRPMMEEAVRTGPKVLMAICLESTRGPSLSVLESATQGLGLPLDVTVHCCAGAWPFFENGDKTGFATAVAASVRTAVNDHNSVVLAQASMQGAAPLLADLGIPVLTSPLLAAQATVAQAKS